jgi:predicted outer membrane repeat protein
MRLLLPLVLLLVRLLPATVLRVPQVYPTIQAALAVNLVGDTVEVAAGTYPIAQTLMLDQGVTLRAAQPGHVRLIQAGSAQVLNNSGMPAYLENLELRNLVASTGNAMLELRACRLVGSNSGTNGNGIAAVDCVFDSISTIHGNGSAFFASCHIRDCYTLVNQDHPDLLFSRCVMQRLQRFGSRGWIPYDMGTITLNQCTLVDCGHPSTTLVGTSLNRLALDRCIVSGLRGPLLGTGNMVPDQVEVTRSDMWGGQAGDWTGVLAPFLGQYGNISANPLFCDPELDFHLQWDTPCLLDAPSGDHMGVLPIGCSPGIHEIQSWILSAALPARVRFVAEVYGEFEDLVWDVDGDGQIDGSGTVLEWNFERPGIYRGHLTGRWGEDMLEGWGPPVAVGGVIRQVLVPEELSGALAISQPGDLVQLGPGRFPSAGLVLPPGVSLAGMPGETSLVGTGQGPILQVAPTVSFRALFDLIFEGGRADRSGALAFLPTFGGASSGLHIRRCHFRDNVADREGGAIAAPWPPILLDLKDCDFSDNRATRGGALHGAGFVLENCGFSGNQATETGGAIHVLDSLWATACAFTDNRAVRGGALALDGPATLRACRFLGNQAVALGGAVWNDPWYSTVGARYEGCLFARNQAGTDGAALFDGTGPRLRSCTLAEDSTSALGAIVSLPAWAGGERGAVERCIVAGAPGGRALACPDERLRITCTDLWGNAHGDWAGLAPWQGQDGNLAADPLFCAPRHGDFTLGVDSPCRPEQTLCGLMGALAGWCGESPVREPLARPAALGLSAAPNPFNGASLIHYTLPRPAPVRLSLFNLLGQQVALLVDETRPAGVHTLRLEPRGWASGLYLLCLEQDGAVAVLKLVLVQ